MADKNVFILFEEIKTALKGINGKGQTKHILSY